MINNKLLKLGFLLGLLLTFTNCSNVIYDEPEVNNGPQPMVYLSVHSGGGTSFRGSFRSSPNEPHGPSINTDTDDYEDWVHSLAMFVFDTTSGDLVVSYFDGGSNNQISTWFTVKMTPGQRDFYFVANMPESDMSSIETRAAMDIYINKAHALDTDLYEKAKENKAFPMARIYLGQDVPEGGSVYNPKPFKPTVIEDGVTKIKDKIELIRAVAQLQVEIHPDDIGSVSEIRYHNVFRNFTLNPFETPLLATNRIYYNPNSPTTEGVKMHQDTNDDKIFTLYMPEALVMDYTPKPTSFDHTAAGDHKPVNYFEIKTTGGESYFIPIVTTDETNPYPGNSTNYLHFARGNGTEKPDYNIYRSTRYKFLVENFSDIEVYYTVAEWEKNITDMYMGYGYNVSVDGDGNVRIDNTVLACDPHDIRLKATGGAKFDGTPGDGESDELRIFKDKAADATKNYKLNNIPSSGVYLEVYYNDEALTTPVKTFSK